MYIICIESSNKRGMGHLFRALLFIDYFKKNHIEYLCLINNDLKSLQILDRYKINYIVIDFDDIYSNWEQAVIKKYHVDVWINDKFTTSIEMGKHISQTGILFCMIDDIGNADIYSDIHFAGMIYPTKKNIQGRKTYCGNEYIILNPEIIMYQRKRENLKKIIVSMGGSDPHDVTLSIVREFKKYQYDVDIVIGPNFKNKKGLLELNKGRFEIFQNIPSLIEKFYDYDLAITGGGVTCCEANASGLPCMIIANAPHEENTGKYVEALGGAYYLGNYEEWDQRIFSELETLNLSKMSQKGIDSFYLDTIQRIMKIIENTYRGEL